ncbi:MAG: DbpA RNA binding domain-containing protein, partial [Acidobacteriota bacterium]
RRILAAIEQVTRSRIERMELPSISDVNDSRVARFEAKLTAALEGGAAREFQPLLEQFQTRHDVPGIEIAAALASMLQGDQPFLLEERPEPVRRHDRYDEDRRGGPRDRPGRGPGRDTEPMHRYRVAVGRQHGVGAGDLVGAIAGESGLEGRRIGRIDLREDHSFVELPAGMPEDIQRHLQTVRVRGEALAIEALGPARSPDRRDTRPRHSGDGPRQRPGGPPRYRDDGGPGGGRKRPPSRGKYGSDTRPPRGGKQFRPEGGKPFRQDGGKQFRPEGGKPFRQDGGKQFRPRDGESRGDDRRSGGGFDLSKPRRSAKAGGFPPKPGGYPAGGPGEESGDKPPRPKKDEPGGRRTGKKARWSKAQKRAAKKSKGKFKG